VTRGPATKPAVILTTKPAVILTTKPAVILTTNGRKDLLARGFG